MVFEHFEIDFSCFFNCVSFFKKIESNVDTIAAKEATLVYHLIKEGQTYRSAVCTSQLIRSVFGENANFTCGETKAEAIATGK